MKVEFWGTRGSIAAPGLATIRYGGNTACISVKLSDGTLIILDAGTGIRKLGNVLHHDHPVSAHLFLSHCHWDHIQGFPFFLPAYLPGTELMVYGYRTASEQIRKTMLDQMDGAYFPVDSTALNASIHFIELWENSLAVGPAQITLIETNHPGGGAGFRITEGDRSLVYLTDNELGAGGRERFVRFCEGATLLVHDAQYTPEEMEKHRGWGHSSTLEVVELARDAGVKQAVLFHHDPERADEEIDALVDACLKEMRRQGDRFECMAAAEGMILIV